VFHTVTIVASIILKMSIWDCYW